MAQTPDTSGSRSGGRPSTGKSGGSGRASTGGSRAGASSGSRSGKAGGGGRPSGRPPSKGGAGGGRRSGPRDAAPTPERATPSHWGSLARKGAQRLDDDRRGAGTAVPSGPERGEWAAEEWIDEGPIRREATRAVGRGTKGATSGGSSTGRGGTARRGAVPEAEIDVTVAEAGRAVGAQRAARLEQRLKEAAKAFEAERYADARRILAPLVDQAPSSVALRELNGLTLYRMGRWKAAAAELEAFRELSGSTEQNPVLADCYRAQKRWRQVDDLWDELRAASPNAELVTEGRIVTAGSLADRHRLPEAIELLEKGFRWPKRPHEHHLRRGYALADLYERAGDVPRARSMFEQIAIADPDFADADQRRRALR